MINGLASETLTRVYRVADEAPVPLPHGSTTIVADKLTVTWIRTVEHGMRPEKITVSGWRGKGKDGAVPTTIPTTGMWSPWRREGHPDDWRSGDVSVPTWALAVALTDCPAVGALNPILDSITMTDLDGLR